MERSRKRSAKQRKERDEIFLVMLQPLVTHMTYTEKLRLVRFFEKYFADPFHLRTDIQCTKAAAMELIDYIRVLENPKYKIFSLPRYKDVKDIELAIGEFLLDGPWFNSDPDHEDDRESTSTFFDEYSNVDFIHFRNRLADATDVKDNDLVRGFYAAGYIISALDKHKSMIKIITDPNKTHEAQYKEQCALLEDRFEVAKWYFWAYIDRLRNSPLTPMDLPVDGESSLSTSTAPHEAEIHTKRRKTSKNVVRDTTELTESLLRQMSVPENLVSDTLTGLKENGVLTMHLLSCVCNYEDKKDAVSELKECGVSVGVASLLYDYFYT